MVRLLARDERIFAVLLALVMVGGLATLGLVSLRGAGQSLARNRVDVYSLVIWFATVLRDAFFYLPTSRVAYHQLQHEKELACDDLAVGVTHWPLALASALAKAWQLPGGK